MLLLPFQGLFFALPLFNRNRQRLADMLSRTAVIEAHRLAPPPPEQTAGPNEAGKKGGDDQTPGRT